jgi:hypothetical protein
MQNGLYFAFSRALWVFGVFCLMVLVLTGQFQLGTAVLGGSNMRFMAKCIIVCCVIQILVVELLFQTQESSMYLTF